MNAVPLLVDFLYESARRLPEKVALVAGDQRITYAELERRVNALAHSLVKRGVARGDRVVVMLESSVDAAVAFWATLAANAVVSMIHPTTKADKLAYLLNDCRARAFLGSTKQASVWRDATQKSEHLATTIVMDGPEPYADPNDVTPPARQCIDIDLASIIYTSGSTGEPKGVMLTHRNMLTAATSITAYLENVEEDVILACLPFSFDYGLYQLIMGAKVGARVVIEKSFTYPAKVLETMAREKVTGFPGVPTMFAMLTSMSNVRDYDLSALRYVTNTAAALPVQHILALRDLFPGARIYSMYGLTECKRCTYLPPADLERKPTSVGIAIPNTELWIVDENDRKVGPGVVGQLVIRGATVMKGYWEKPEQTARKLRPGPFSQGSGLPGEQVLYTGDLCKLDEEGYLYFIGRMDDIIKSRGEKVAPKEIEAVLYAMPGVREAAVIGVPDAVLGEAPKAFVVVDDASAITEKDLRRFCQEKMESFMVPASFELRSSPLPKSDNGKIDKKALK